MEPAPEPSPSIIDQEGFVEQDLPPPVQWKRIFRESILLYAACPLFATTYIVLYLIQEGAGLASAQLVGEITGAVSSQAAEQNNETGLVGTFWMWTAIGLTLMFLALPVQYVAGKMDGRMSRKLRTRLFDSIMRQSPDFFHKKDSGQLTMIVNQFSIDTQMTLRQALMEPLLQVAMIAATSGMLVYNFLKLESENGIEFFGVSIPVPFLLLLVLIVALCSPWLVSLMSRRIRTSSADLRNKNLRLASLVNGVMGSPEEIQSMNAEAFFSKKHDKAVEQYIGTRIRQGVTLELVNLLNRLPVWLIPSILLGFAVLLSIRASDAGDVGNLVAIFMLAPQLIAPVQSISGYLVMVGSAWPGIHQVLELIDDGEVEESHVEKGDPSIADSSIVVKDLSFSYQPDLPLVFDGLSFSVKPGSTVGLVGKMGQGKTTFFRLALKFYSPQSGQILLGGQPLNKFTAESVRKRIAMMSQFPAFFHDTVRENLRIAQPDCSDEEMMRVCRLTGINEIITQRLGTDDPLNADFAEGRRLSGGQRKLFALTRCLLRDPDVILLDEPTTGMDNAEKFGLIDRIKDATEGITVVTIDHDLSWLSKFCDHILVLDGGRIVETGSGDELLKQQGVFHQLYQLSQRDGCE